MLLIVPMPCAGDLCGPLVTEIQSPLPHQRGARYLGQRAVREYRDGRYNQETAPVRSPTFEPDRLEAAHEEVGSIDTGTPLYVPRLHNDVAPSDVDDVAFGPLLNRHPTV